MGGWWLGLGRWGWRCLPLLALAILIGAITIAMPSRGRHVPAAEACAFVEPPTTYETTEDRRYYMVAMELAGHDLLFPKDGFFSQPSMEVGTRQNRANQDVFVPPTLLKSIS